MAGSKRKFACAINLQSLLGSDCYFDVLGSLVIILDKKGTIRLFNSGAEEMLGYSQEEVIGKNWFNTFLPKDIRATVKIIFEEMISGKRDFIDRYENEVINKKGERINLQWHSSVLRDNQNKVEGVVASASNITDLVKAKSDLDRLVLDLQTKEEHLAMAVEATGMGIWDWNIETDEVILNKEFANSIGYSLEEITPMTFERWKKFIHPDDIIKAEKLLDEHFSGKTESYLCELRLKHKNGDWVWFLNQGRVFDRDSKGKPIRMAGTHLNINERKKQEKELEEKLKELERLNELMVGRELKMIDLKREIGKMKKNQESVSK